MCEKENQKLTGQPQCLRNVIIVGLPLGFGNGSLGDEGALELISGGDWTSIGDGENHELSSCWKVILILVCICDC